MKMRMMMAALLAAAGMMAGTATAQSFSDGLTGIGGSPVVNSAAAEMKAKEAAAASIEAQAQEVLKGNGRLDASGATAPEAISAYRLGAGDKVRVSVFGEEDLSGEFEVDGTGMLALPLVGEMKVGGLTVREAEKAFTKKLDEGYLVNPRVSVQVLNFRPFFILGEVNKPGSYPYVNDMTVISAIALAGGYTPRAKTGVVLIKRASDPERKEVDAAEDARVGPGDVIRVDERFF